MLTVIKLLVEKIKICLTLHWLNYESAIKYQSRDRFRPKFLDVALKLRFDTLARLKSPERTKPVTGLVGPFSTDSQFSLINRHTFNLHYYLKL